ncbi:MAG: lytic transglycosylase domain-containing protein [Treponema sp.]|jgi:soluble lytic murein transglycosylase|nr:lytic transglycosylase domain-containing protein [Treponema sp.]
MRNDFYLGLLDYEIETKITHFEKALSCTNEYIRRAASEELSVLMSQGNELSPKTMMLVRREAHGFWAAAFETTNNLSKEKALSFLLGFDLNTPSFNEARLFVLRECEKRQLVFSEKETSAIQGHHAVNRLRYNEALDFFRGFMEPNINEPAARSWPLQIPQIFIEYPNLINDLGRAFQYTQSGSEGLYLFLQWETELQNENSINKDLLNDLRYGLIFFAARISQRLGSSSQGLNEQGISLFERALSLAKTKDSPDEAQLDACIWYILDMSASGSTRNFINRLEEFIPQWNRVSTFNTIMERFLHRLVSANDWINIYRTFELLKGSNANVPKAAFAWVVTRLIEEGFLNVNQIGSRLADPLYFAHIAYYSSNDIFIQSLYYRLQSASALGLPFFETMLENNSVSKPSPKLEFILGFFNNDAKDLAIPYIRMMESEMTIEELRGTAQALSKAGMYIQVMRLVSLYINRDGYTRERRDLELLFPQAYLELVEAKAKEFGITPYTLFALIRTESAFQSAVVSRAGATGLAQLMPATARDMADRIRRSGGPDFYGPENSLDLTDPFLNVYIGSYYLNHLIGRFNGDEMLALMSYNGGQTRVRRWWTTATLPVDLFVESVPIYETRDYGKRVLGVAAAYKALYY